MNYYNDNNPESVAWLKQLIVAGLIPNGDVDGRSIADVKGSELTTYTQCHFFAGISGWSEAIRLAGFPSDRRVWTGSCPCQPFSAAGKHKGTEDKRHLWPELRRLISESKPDLVFGEQVASKAGREWLSGVQLDLEGMGFAFGAADLCAAGIGEDGEVGLVRGGEIEWQRATVGTPHIRQRLWWVADARRERYERRGESGIFSGATEDTKDSVQERERGGDAASDRGPACGLGYMHRQGMEGSKRQELQGGRGGSPTNSFTCCCVCGEQHSEDSECQPIYIGVGHSDRDGEERTRPQQYLPDATGSAGRLAHSGSERREWDTHLIRPTIQNPPERNEKIINAERSSTNFWSGFDLIPCLDNKARRVESFTQSMVNGLPESLGRVRDEIAEKIEEEVVAHGKSVGIDAREVLRGLWVFLQKKAASVRIMGERAMLCEEAILLNILLKLQKQGWPLAESLSRESEEVAREAVRVLRHRQAPSGSPCGSGLDKQRADQPANHLHILSPLLARHAYQAWIEAEHANAKAVFPLINGGENRLMRLKGYGNAIVPEVAAVFIKAWMEVTDEFK